MEDFNWFSTPKAAGAYSFVGSLLRFGVARTSPSNDLSVELSQPTLIGLPTKASASGAVGALGPGANYYSANRGQEAGLFVKQAFDRVKWRQGQGRDSFRFGRFEFADSEEVKPANETLNYLKQMRILNRLISPSTYTHVGRSLDGVQYIHDARPWNFSMLGAMPTRGVYSLSGADTLDRIKLGYAAGTLAQPGTRTSGESRLFAIVYADERTNIVKVDNRPTAVRAADKEGVHLITVGGHDLRVFDLGAGRFDTFLWGAGQVGTWGVQSQLAYSYDAEIGYQLTHLAWKPWFRLAYSFGSGDANPRDSVHGTFIPILTTTQKFARFPFYGQSNIKDLFGQVILHPTPKLIVRSDLHGLRLANSNDLWYSGSGAYDDANFGYTGRPSGGHDGLATLVDTSLDFAFAKSLSATLYLAYARGGDVITSTYTGRDAAYGYVEMLYHF